MKRLLQISFDTLLLSIIPIIIWNSLGFILDKDLVVIFTLTYPIQFLFSILYYIFGVGPNITAEKRKDKNIVYTNIYLGIFIGLIILLILVFNCDSFLRIMSSDISIFRTFTIYSFCNLFYSYILKLILEKLYYEKENKKANIISLSFNLTNLILLTIIALITKSQIITSIITLLVMLMFLIIILILNTNRFTVKVLFIDNLKNSSIGIVDNIAMFIIYFVGYINSFDFGYEYVLVSTFVGIVSDTQWDMIYAIENAVHIDVSKDKFKFKEHLKNGYKLAIFLLITSTLMSIVLYHFYEPDLTIFLICFMIQVVDILFFPIIEIRQQYLQIKKEETGTKPTVNTGISKCLRMLCSFLHNPYCTYIGQIVEMIYNYIYTKIVSIKIKELN